MTCRCEELATRLAAVESRLGMTPPRQPSLFAGLPESPDIEPPATKYPAAFEELWERTGKRGGKYPARVAWERAARPPWAAIAPGWTAYMRSDAPVRLSAVQHLSTWLNAKGWEQDWPPAAGKVPRPPEPAGAAAPVIAPPKETRCFTHTENPRWKARVIADWCPDCREQAARAGTREMTEDAAMELPKWTDITGGTEP